MASRTFNLVIGTVVVLALGGAVAAVRLDAARLRPKIAWLKDQRQQTERLRDENRQLQEIVARVQVDAGDGTRAIHADLVRARAELEELERNAGASYAQIRRKSVQEAENLVNNRDPEKGQMRLEHFQNKGQATPAAAFQTFVWAAMKGEDATLAGMISMDSAAREKGMAALTALPGETRAKYSTPEKLAALFFAAALTGQPSAQVLDVSIPDPQHAMVQVRGLTDKTQMIPMHLGAQGWQIVVPVGMAERLRGWRWGNSSPSEEVEPAW